MLALFLQSLVIIVNINSTLQQKANYNVGILITSKCSFPLFDDGFKLVLETSMVTDVKIDIERLQLHTNCGGERPRIAKCSFSKKSRRPNHCVTFTILVSFLRDKCTV